MVVVRFTTSFEKQLKKRFSKQEAAGIVKTLLTTRPTDGKYIALVGNVLLKERKMKSFRFYFVQDNKRVQFLSEEDLRTHILQFVGLSKKHNQQHVIDRLKEELKSFGFDQ